MRCTIAEEFIVFGGTANPPLADAVAARLDVALGRSEVERFPDGEVSVRLLDSVRRKDVFVVQPTSPPVDEHLVELLCFADAARRAAADRVTAVIPYFGYGRADKRHGRRESITARMVGDVLQAAGVDHVITIDLHAPQIEGFFSVPVDSLTAVGSIASALRDGLDPPAAIAAPDAGRVRMATDYAQRLELPLVVLHKRRESGTETHVTRVVGEVEGRHCILIDDMISTGGTVASSVDALMRAGARGVTIAATHGLLLAGARQKLSHDGIREVVVSDTIAAGEADWPRLRVVSVAPLVASAIRQFLADGSLAGLFGDGSPI